MSYLVVSPAYGRDYKNAKDAKADWTSGKDFVNESAMFTGGGTYVNSNDWTGSVEIRYARKTKAAVINK